MTIVKTAGIGLIKAAHYNIIILVSPKIIITTHDHILNRKWAFIGVKNTSDMYEAGLKIGVRNKN